jgi:hypothetical protein
MTSFAGNDLAKKSGLSPVKQMTLQTSMSGTKEQNIKPYSSSQVKPIPGSAKTKGSNRISFQGYNDVLRVHKPLGQTAMTMNRIKEEVNEN